MFAYLKSLIGRRDQEPTRKKKTPDATDILIANWSEPIPSFARRKDSDCDIIQIPSMDLRAPRQPTRVVSFALDDVQRSSLAMNRRRSEIDANMGMDSTVKDTLNFSQRKAASLEVSKVTSMDISPSAALEVPLQFTRNFHRTLQDPPKTIIEIADYRVKATPKAEETVNFIFQKFTIDLKADIELQLERPSILFSTSRSLQAAAKKTKTRPTKKYHGLFCPFCYEKFTRKDSLRRHVRAHSGRTPFGCWICGKHFSRNDSLNQHLPTHTSHRPYPCPRCDESFKSREARSKHLEKIHDVKRRRKYVS